MNSHLPILYYHSVADHPRQHPWAFLSARISEFRRQMEWLSLHRYRTVTWKELRSFLEGSKPLPSKSLMIQFDDGFLDNWSVVFPIMRDLDLCYSIVVSADFIDPSEEIRPFVRDTLDEPRERWWGYLNLEEMRRMEKSGLVDIQSHSQTHTWYECGPAVLGRFSELKSRRPLPWLYWNQRPERKPHWLLDDWEAEVDPDAPVFEHGKALEIRRYLPSREYTDLLLRGFDQRECTERLGVDGLGRHETDDERRDRMRIELASVKHLLEQELSKQVDALVWPGGGYGEESLRIARDLGYRIFSKGKELNRFGSGSTSVSRLAGILSLRGKPLPAGQLWFLNLQLLRGRSPGLNAAARIVKNIVR